MKKVFFYGSKNLDNLRQILGLDQIMFDPVIMYNYVRIFTGYSETHGCSPCTIIKGDGYHTTGFMVNLTERQLHDIHKTEGYRPNRSEHENSYTFHKLAPVIVKNRRTQQFSIENKLFTYTKTSAK
jgi:hypothetical protein